VSSVGGTILRVSSYPKSISTLRVSGKPSIGRLWAQCRTTIMIRVAHSLGRWDLGNPAWGGEVVFS
jgi:hypothetical protein